MAQTPKKNIKVEFTKSKDFRTIAATGAWGGLGPQGELICNFFVEKAKLLDKMTVEVDPLTGTVKEIRDSAEDIMEREFQVCIVMRADIAKVVGEWLIKNAEPAITSQIKKN